MVVVYLRECCQHNCNFRFVIHVVYMGVANYSMV